MFSYLLHVLEYLQEFFFAFLKNWYWLKIESWLLFYQLFFLNYQNLNVSCSFFGYRFRALYSYIIIHIIQFVVKQIFSSSLLIISSFTSLRGVMALVKFYFLYNIRIFLIRLGMQVAYGFFHLNYQNLNVSIFFIYNFFRLFLQFLHLKWLA